MDSQSRPPGIGDDRGQPLPPDPEHQMRLAAFPDRLWVSILEEDAFDSIVLAEVRKGVWMPGSDHFITIFVKPAFLIEKIP